jgi:hypothetical protein
MRCLASVVLLLILAGSAQAGTTRLGSLTNESFLRTEGEHRLVAVRDGREYRLALWRDGKAEPLPIEPLRHYPQADIGTDRDGAVAVLLSRCDDYRRRRCDLFIHRIGTPGERPVRGANTRAAERAPTISRGRIAWARGAHVYTRLLASRRAAPSRRLASVPRRRCDLRWLPSQSCRLKFRSVDDLELQGLHLAADMSYVSEGGSGHYQREVRLVGLRGGNRRLATDSTGEGGQATIGLSFAAGRLGWARVCYGDPCRGRAYRYTLRSGRYETAETPALAGFSLTATGYLGVDGRGELGEDEEEECDDFDRSTPPAPACPVIEVDDVDFKRTDGRRIRD